MKFNPSKMAKNNTKAKKMKRAPPNLGLNKVQPKRGLPAITNGCLVLCRVFHKM